MKGLYNGKEVCHGCRRSGTEVPRYSKDELCQKCKETYNLGKAKEVELKATYRKIRQFVHAYHNSETNRLMAEFIRVFDNPTAPTEGDLTSFKYYTGDNVWYAVIDSRLIEPISKLLSTIDEAFTNINKSINDLPQKAKSEVSKEKDRIYNEGVEYGRNLLLQLNKGEITVNQFDKKVTYNS